MENNIPPEYLAAVIGNQELRIEAAQTFAGFCLIYLSHYFFLERADFHPELMAHLQNSDELFLAIAGFRGSAKSTLANTALVLYEALIRHNPFIILINETDDVAKLSIANIREELESNELIKADFGDLTKKTIGVTKFSENNIVLANGVRIMGRSRGQKIRGLRHKQYRPTLVIIDDPEERERVQKKEYRDKTERWLRGDIIPAIEETKARLIVIGNVLHTDSLLARLKKDHKVFIYLEYSLIREGSGSLFSRCTWRGKYPSEAAIKKQEAKVGHNAFLREYLLKVVPPEGQEVKEEWIRYYDALPQLYTLDKEGKQIPIDPWPITKSGVGVDLAISKKDTADYTSAVPGLGIVHEGMPHIYILPNPTNDRLSFHETIAELKRISQAMKIYSIPKFYMEDVQYQRAAIEEAERNLLIVEAMKPGSDKRARLRAAATHIQNGIVLFPREGCEDLLAQILGFGVEDHDDLVDAFVYLILGFSSEGVEYEEVEGLF